MIIDKFPVLDKGEVALISSSIDGRMIADIEATWYKTAKKSDLLDMANVTMMIKCPLFVQLNLSKFGFKIMDIPSETLEAYIPNVDEINAKNVDRRKNIYAYLKQTIESLILNAKSMPMDGCNDFVAQTTMPIGIYNKLIVHGSISTWGKFLKQQNLPKPIESYRKQLEQILSAQWNSI